MEGSGIFICLQVICVDRADENLIPWGVMEIS